MITKKLGKINFGWDPNALKGKGYWYVLGRGESYARAASQKEAQKLGKPKEEQLPKNDADKRKYYYTTNPKTGQIQRKLMRTGSQYEEAAITRNKGLMQIASERVAQGQGMGSALKGAIGDKLKAKVTGIKEKFDPMNMLTKLPGVGKLAATAYGMKRGRAASDISHFTGIHVPGKMNEIDKPETTSKVSGGVGTDKMSKGSIGVLKKIHKLISDKFEEDIKIRETEESFREEERAESNRKHKELIDAILKGIKPKSKTKPETKPEGGGFFKNLFEMFKGGLNGVFKSLMPILKAFGSGLMAILAPLAGILAPLALVIGGVIAGAKLIDKGYEFLTGKSSDSYSKTYDPSSTSKEMQSYMKQRQLSGVSDKATESGQAKAMEEYKKTGKITNKFTGKDETKQRLAEIDKFKKYKEFKKTDPYQQYKTEVLEKDYKGEKRPTFEEWKTTKGMKPAVDKSKSVPSKQQQTATPVSKPVPDTVNPKSEEAIYKKLLADSPEEWKKDPTYIRSLKEEAHMEYMSQPKAVPSATPPSPVGPRAVAATKENQNLTGPSSGASSPVVVNKTTNVVNNGGSIGGGNGGSMVRNDDAVLTRLQFQNVRPI